MKRKEMIDMVEINYDIPKNSVINVMADILALICRTSNVIIEC